MGHGQGAIRHLVRRAFPARLNSRWSTHGSHTEILTVPDAIAENDHVALRYQCSPYHTGTALWPVTQQLAFAASLNPAETDATNLDKLGALLHRGAENIGDAVPLIAALLGI